MSLEQLENIFGDLPFNLRDPILGYASSVKQALPSICREAGIRREQGLEDDVVLIAGIKKFHGIVSSTFSTLNKALRYLEDNEMAGVSLAGKEYSFKSFEYRRLLETHERLQRILAEENITSLIEEFDYVQIVRMIADERRQH